VTGFFMDISTLANNQYAVFIKDYWAVIAALGFGVFLVFQYLIKSAMKIDKIPTIETDVTALQKDATYIKGKLSSIEKLLKTMVSGSQATNQIASRYGVAHSPVTLRDEFREYITDPKLDEQVKSKNKELLNWLKEQKPRTGLDMLKII
jgi:hypothetical protein